ncbi:MAG: choice-of-anchor D domain-containing protein, partial [Aureibaculum sp.]|nr:choice-of-anchor D domain-containing protein [Aureibaculum sp.]
MKKLLCTLTLFLLTIGLAQAQQEIDVQGNGISIIGDGSNVPAIADDTDFGQIAPGASSTEHVFTILNTGTAPLSVNPSFTTNTPVFTVTTAAVSPVPAGGSTTIGITFNAPLTPGIIGATLVIFNNDADEFVYQINLQGESLAPAAPEINVQGNGISIIGDGTNVPNVADGTDFGQVTTGTPSAEQSFTIQNLGTTPLSVISYFTTNPDFAITTTPAASIPASGSTTIGLTYTANATLGVVNATLFIFNGDADESPYQINIQGESVLATGPEIDVLGNGISIIGDGTNTPNIADDTDFGQVAPLASSVEHIFTIQNTGTSPLTVNPSFTTNPIFAVTTGAISPVAAGGSTTIGVTFTAPVTPGIYNAQLIIFNSDSDEGLYQINIRGESFIAGFPEIDVLGNAISIIGDGTNIPNVADGTDFGTVVTGNSSTEQVFTIQNTGGAPLSVNPSNLTDPNFVITTAAVSPVAIGGSTTIGITFNAPVTLGVYNATLFIANDDSDENPYQINITAESIPAAGPEMDVFGLGTEIANG